MASLKTALKEKFSTPQAVLKALGLDEALITSPNIGAPNVAEKDTKDAEPAFLKNMKAEDRKAYDDWMEGDRKRARDEWEKEAKDRRAKDETAAEEEKKKKEAEDRKRAHDAEEETKKKREAEDSKRVKDRRAEDARRRLGRDETEEERKKREDEEEAGDKRARDAEAIQKGVEMLEKSGGAMDAAIGKAVSAALDVERKHQAALREAIDTVRPFVGALALDEKATAETVYSTALTMKGVDKADLAGLPLAGLKSVFKHAVQRAAPSGGGGQRLAMDKGSDSVVASVLKGFKAPAKV